MTHTTAKSGVSGGKMLLGLAIIAAGLGGWVYSTQTSTDQVQDERILEMQVDITDIGGKPASAAVTAHTIGSLTGRMSWTGDNPDGATYTTQFYVQIRVLPGESVQAFLAADPLGGRGVRRAVTCSIKVSGKPIKGSPQTLISYPGEDGKPCGLSITIPALTR